MDKINLKQILFDQKKEIEKITSDKTLIERDILAESKKYIKTDLIKIITGVRRSGKSVFSLQLLKDKKFAYVNFDDEKLFNITSNDLNDVLEVLHEIYPNFKYLFLDEVQNIYGWELFANRCRRQGHNILITGSNAKLLSRELATHLTGRHVAIELYPFSFNEFLKYHHLIYTDDDFYLTEKRAQIKRHLNDYIKNGGFPEALRYIEIHNRYLSDLYNTIIGKDIINRYNIRNSKSMKDISIYLISNYGSQISYNKLKNLFDIKSVHTAENYAEYIEEAYLIFQLHRFSFKTKLQLITSGKVYSTDTGLANVISPRSFDNTGRLIENVVALELKKRSKEIYYWRSDQQEEVDFVIKHGLKVVQLIQVSYNIDNINTKERETKALVKAGDELKCDDLIIITWDYEAQEETKGKKIKYIPLWKWLLNNNL